MKTLELLIENFFTHKDFLPPADKLAGTLFTPLHLIFSGLLLAAVIVLAILLSKKDEKIIRRVFTAIWAAAVVLEIVKITWETVSGKTVNFEWGGILPLYPCSIFMYAMPFAIWGKNKVRYAACGYVCTLGFLGAAINFVYPANIMQNYSCISFAGFHTLLFHGSMLFCCLVMLMSGYHSFKDARRWEDLILPALPCFIVSIAAHIVNFSPIGSDYMFFKLNSFFLAPLGAALPDLATVFITYVAYLIIHTTPYIPCFIINKRKASE